MNEVTTFKFNDATSRDESVAIIRAASGIVGVALSQLSNGDLEVFLSVDSARQLVSALQQAVAVAENRT